MVFNTFCSDQTPHPSLPPCPSHLPLKLLLRSRDRGPRLLWCSTLSAQTRPLTLPCPPAPRTCHSSCCYVLGTVDRASYGVQHCLLTPDPSPFLAPLPLAPATQVVATF